MDSVALLDQPAPLFCLTTVDGRIWCLEEKRGKIVVLNFWSAECPWAERADKVLMELLQQWGPAVLWCSVASNANEPSALLEKTALERDLPVVLLDPQNRAADLYGALTTPHFFVVDGSGILRYQGAMDDVTFRQRLPTRNFLDEAVKALLNGQLPDPAQQPAYGCTIVRALPQDGQK